MKLVDPSMMLIIGEALNIFEDALTNPTYYADQSNSTIELTPDQYEIYDVDEQAKCLPAAKEQR